jgi:integral membrane sensor domain MASE1
MFPRKFGPRAESLIALRRTLRTELIRFLAPGNLEVFAVLAVSCFVTGNFGNQLAVFHGSVTAIWPPTGIALAAVLLKGRRVWPGIYLGAFLVHLKFTGSLSNSLGMGTLNTLEVLTAAHLVNTFASGTNAFFKVQNVLRFFFLAGLLATALCATAGVAVLCHGGFARWSDYGSTWLVWWVGDMLATLLLTPFLVLLFTHKHHSLGPSELLEATLLLTGLSIVCVLNFGPPVVSWIPGAGLLYMCLPFLAWSALRFCPLEAAGTALLMGAFAIWGSIHGYGPYGNTTTAPLFVVGYVVVACTTTLAIAASNIQQKLAVQDALGLYYVQKELKDAEIRSLRDTLESLEDVSLAERTRQRR